jgi:hypothetical protein
VQFSGLVKVVIPHDVPANQQRALAEKYALARIVATTDNPDGPEQDACDEYAEEFAVNENVAGNHWDRTYADGVSGLWTAQNGRAS